MGIQGVNRDRKILRKQKRDEMKQCQKKNCQACVRVSKVIRVGDSSGQGCVLGHVNLYVLLKLRRI